MKFTPKLLPTIVCLMMFVAMISLGFWQLSRYHFKKSVLDKFHAALSQKPISLAQLNQVKNKAFQHVAVDGRFINKDNLLLQHRYHGDKLGFEVISPFQVLTTKKIVLVDRGWVAANRALQPLKKLKQIDGLQQVSGFVLYPHKGGFNLGKNIMQPDVRPLQIQKIDIAQIQKIMGRPLYSFFIYMDKQSKHGFVREWKPTVMKPERHFGYMIQWFAMSLALLIAYLAFSCKRKD